MRLAGKCGQIITFGYRGLQRVRHLPAILPPQRCCDICYSPVNDQDRQAIETPRELAFFAFKTGEDFSERDDGECNLSLHPQYILVAAGTPWKWSIMMMESIRTVE